MALATTLINTPARETGATGGRYDFQTMWGLALLFQQHGTNDDYAIIFEFHDDVALLDHAVNPTSVRFYQVKSKATNHGWTLTSLLKREKVKTEDGVKEKPSYIDKMYDNVDKFQGAVLSADFVSNQLCGFNAEKTSFRLNECTEKDFKKIVASVKESYPAATEALVGVLGFQRTDLSLSDAISHTKGKLQTFIAEQLGTVWFSPEAVYQAIVDECRRKANFSGEVTSLQQAIKDKGLTKNNVQEWLDAIQSSSRSPEWSTIAPSLSLPFSEQLRINQEYGVYRAAALNSADRAVQRVRMKISEAIPSVIDDPKLSLDEMIASIYGQAEETAKKYLTPFSAARLKAMIIYEIYTYY
ncbi:dsDNA nuclease domain-containing protein [Novosphingobium nitrogenifigens]|nr:dsDNA nuclease domain-containing protein [Novosphingobium nitrogenifigens]